MGFLQLARYITFGSTLLFSVIVLGLSADILNETEQFDFYFTWSAFSIAVSVITILSLVPIFIIDITRRGAFTSFVVTEISWLSLLWVLWLAAAAYATDINAGYFGTSSCNFIDSEVNKICREWNAIEALSFLAWLVLLAYTITLLVFAIIAATRGQKAWLTSVRDGFGPVPEKPVIMTTAPAPVQQVPVSSVPYSTPTPQTTYYPQQAAMSVARAEV